MSEILDTNAQNNILPKKYTSLAPLAVAFPNIVLSSKLQILDNEWRMLGVEDLPFDHTDMDPEQFWGRF